MTNSMAEMTEQISQPLWGAKLLGSLSAEVQRQLADSAHTIPYTAGDALFPEGAGADALYIIREGTFRAIEPEATRDPRVVRIFERGAVADGVIELAGERRPVIVLADVDSLVTIIPGHVVDRLVALHADFREMRDRLHRRELLGGLSHLFGPLDDELTDALEAEAEWVHLHRGDVLWEPGAPPDGLYFIVSGRVVALAVQPDGSERLEYELGRGDTLGAMGFLDGKPRRFRVRAIRDSLMIGYTSDEFERLIGRKPQVVRKITAGLAAQAEARQRHLRNAVTTIALIAASPNAPTAEFARRLEKALSAMGSVLSLNVERVERILTEPGISEAVEDSSEEQRLLAWLDSAETRYRFVIFEIDPDAELWSKRCIRRSDRLLLVASAADHPARQAAELKAMSLASSGAETHSSLILVHEDGSIAPSGTRHWLEARPEVTDHFHVRWDRDADVNRIARVLSGRSTGLVLGGGGARGFAHIGLVRALAEYDIPIDAVGGTSMGASVAGQFAMGRDAATIAEMSRKVFLEVKPHRGYTLPLLGLVDSKRIELAGKVAYGEVEIEDLWLPFFCVSSSLTSAEVMVHRAGTLWRAAHASACLPGVGTPVLHQKHLLVDGALLNNLPTDIMRRLGYNTVIASVVSVDESGTFTAERVPTLWEAVRSRFVEDEKDVRFPSIVEVVLRASLLHSAYAERTNAMHADLTVHPAVENFGLLDFERIDEIVDAGYQKATATFEQWRKQAGDLFT